MSIKVSFENVDDHSRTFNKIRNSFSDDFLGITDEKTTISANANGKEAFEKATATMVKMGK